MEQRTFRPREAMETASPETQEYARVQQMYRELAALAKGGTSKQDFTLALVEKTNAYIQTLQAEDKTNGIEYKYHPELDSIYCLALQAWYESNSEEDVTPNEAQILIACAQNKFDVNKRKGEIVHEENRTKQRGPEPLHVAMCELNTPFVESEIFKDLLFPEFTERLENVKGQYRSLRADALQRLSGMTEYADIRSLIEEIKTKGRHIEGQWEQYKKRRESVSQNLEKANLSFDIYSICQNLKANGAEPVHGVMHHLVTTQVAIINRYLRIGPTNRNFQFLDIGSPVEYICTEILLTAPTNDGIERLQNRYNNQFMMLLNNGYPFVERSSYDADKSKVYAFFGMEE